MFKHINLCFQKVAMILIVLFVLLDIFILLSLSSSIAQPYKSDFVDQKLKGKKYILNSFVIPFLVLNLILKLCVVRFDKR